MAADQGDAGLIGVALAHGFALAVIVYAWGPISGAHVNPAVTFGVAIAGKIEWIKALAYWIAQFAGAVVAAFVLKFIVDGLDYEGLGETVGILTNDAPGKTILVEAILTFFLVTAVFGSAVAGRNGAAFWRGNRPGANDGYSRRRASDRREHESRPNIRSGVGHAEL